MGYYRKPFSPFSLAGALFRLSQAIPTHLVTRSAPRPADAYVPTREKASERIVDRSKITTIHQAVRAGGAPIKVKKPERYLHASRTR